MFTRYNGIEITWPLVVARYLRAQILLDRALYESDGFRSCDDDKNDKIISRAEKAEDALKALFSVEEWDVIQSDESVPILEEF